jgi:drug/metabolite transporter (DMT)-like permease
LVFDIILLRILPPLILGAISYPFIGLRTESPLFFFKYLATLILFNMACSALCFCISLSFTSVGLANLVAVLVILFEMLFGGLLLNKQNMPKILYWICDWSFFNNAMEALVVNEVNGLTLVEHKFGFDIDVSHFWNLVI